MNEQAIQEQYQHIVNLLEQKRLKEAQVQLEAFFMELQRLDAPQPSGAG